MVIGKADDVVVVWFYHDGMVGIPVDGGTDNPCLGHDALSKVIWK